MIHSIADPATERVSVGLERDTTQCDPVVVADGAYVAAADEVVNAL